jgi:hypothetical protein
MKFRKIIVLLLLLAAVAFSGCKSRKMLSGSAASGAKNETAALVQAAQPNYATANISKMNINLQAGEKKLSSPATCRIYRDSTIHLSIQPFMGIELFRLELSKDKVLALDKMNAVYYEMSYEEMLNLWRVPFSFSDIQAALTNRFFCIGENGRTDHNDIKISPVTASKKEIRFDTKKLLQKTTIDKDYLIRELEIRSGEGNFSFRIVYDDFQNITGVNAPQKLTLEIANEDYPVSCEFLVSRVTFDKEVKVAPSNTERYTRGTVDDLLNLFN